MRRGFGFEREGLGKKWVRRVRDVRGCRGRKGKQTRGSKMSGQVYLTPANARRGETCSALRAAAKIFRVGVRSPWLRRATAKRSEGRARRPERAAVETPSFSTFPGKTARDETETSSPETVSLLKNFKKKISKKKIPEKNFPKKKRGERNAPRESPRRASRRVPPRTHPPPAKALPQWSA